MDVDLGLTSNQYSVTLVVFFVTYVVFEVPSNMILAKTKPSIYLPIIMTLWGAVTCCMALAHSYHALIALRLIVGVLEAGFAPGILLILSSWYKKDEQSKRFAVYISAAVLSGAFGGVLAGAITGGLDGVRGLEGWRWLFVSRHPRNEFLTRSTDRFIRSLKVLQPAPGPYALTSSSSTSPQTQSVLATANASLPSTVLLPIT
jgi:MFS family permease